MIASDRRAEVSRDVIDDGPPHPRGDVVPADRASYRVLAGVEAVTAERREVDPADEGDLAVDDDQLLVVAVERPLARVQRDVDARAAGQLVADVPDLAAVGRALGLHAILGGLCSTNIAVADRKLNIGRLTLIDLGSYATGLVCTILLAWWLRSVWSLVLGTFVQASLKLAASHLLLEGPRNVRSKRSRS